MRRDINGGAEIRVTPAGAALAIVVAALALACAFVAGVHHETERALAEQRELGRRYGVASFADAARETAEVHHAR